MSTLKTFAKYAIWLILFWVLSDILIYYGINSTYKAISNKGENPKQVTINSAEATKVNGRIIGKVSNDEENDLSGKFLKIDLYAENGNLLATEYEEIGNLRANEVKSFETYFKMQDVKSYGITVVEQKEENTDGVFMTEDMTKIGVLALLTYMIFF
ncbi:unknown [Clostridium sp. CAG:356]|nr:MAG: hypothetical protein BHW02_06980 [Clostridium sp. 28_12]CDD36878.1 unknown [Clostridium sp. CAG:356]